MGRNFECSKCPEGVKKLRRCEEDRFDFTKDDNTAIWPMYVNKGGPMFGFCPGKSTWDHDAVYIFSLVELAFYTRSLAFSGALFDQPSWYVDIISTFLPHYDQLRFNQRMKSMWGSGDSVKKETGKNSARAKPKARRR